jgi:hypothetical protein
MLILFFDKSGKFTYSLELISLAYQSWYNIFSLTINQRKVAKQTQRREVNADRRLPWPSWFLKFFCSRQ